MARREVYQGGTRKVKELLVESPMMGWVGSGIKGLVGSIESCNEYPW